MNPARRGQCSQVAVNRPDKHMDDYIVEVNDFVNQLHK